MYEPGNKARSASDYEVARCATKKSGIAAMLPDVSLIRFVLLADHCFVFSSYLYEMCNVLLDQLASD